MKKLVFLLLALFSISVAHAQSFTQYVQQEQPGKGKVTVTQTKEIDNLVNGTAKESNVPTTQQKTNATPQKAVATPQKSTSTPQQKTVATPQKAKEEEHKAEEHKAEERRAEEHKAEERHRAETQKTQDDDDEMNIPTVDMRKKVMRGSRKVNGYRVQAYAGGNSRADKQKAHQIGDNIKMRYPDQPVYVHFYNPRWICRVGNYRTYAEASRMLKAVKAMGYKSASIVKGKITVFE